MGQKTHPYDFRLVYNKTWHSRWYAQGREYAMSAMGRFTEPAIWPLLNEAAGMTSTIASARSANRSRSSAREMIEPAGTLEIIDPSRSLGTIIKILSSTD